MKTETDDFPVFHLGIVMAGAVSAGAFTAGVMDYLLETLEVWDQAKKKNLDIIKHWGGDLVKAQQQKNYDRSVPMHRVVIDVLAGASAGGMTAAITAMSLFEGIEHYRDGEPDLNSRNRLYDSWVNLNDLPSKSTFCQMLDCQDITDKQALVSLLNSKPIDTIAKKLDSIQLRKKITDYDYISPALNLVLTLCSLRGVPIDIGFSPKTVKPTPAPGDDELEKVVVPSGQRLTGKTAPAHRMYLHRGVGQFSFQPKNEPGEPHVMRLDPADKADRLALIETAIATGAFPFGLEYRKLKVGDGRYIRAQVKRMFNLHDDDLLDVKVAEKEPFNFVAVDGGTINNEPIGEVERLLWERVRAGTPAGMDAVSSHPNFGIVMIDPFPNFEENEVYDEKKEPKSLFQLAPKLLSAIRQQAMMKEGDLQQGLRGNYTKRLIFPRKINRTADGAASSESYIACGSLDGFGGFLSRKFRDHDFRLGRKNCQGFLRKYFSLPEDQSLTLLGQWTPEAQERFGIEYQEEPEVRYHPIIPDLRLTVENPEAGRYDYPVIEKITLEEVCAFYPDVRRRVRSVLYFYLRPGRLLRTFTDNKTEGSAEEKLKEEARLTIQNQASRLAGGTLKRALLWAVVILLLPVLLPVGAILYFVGIELAAIVITRKKVLHPILKDLQQHGLLKTEALLS